MKSRYVFTVGVALGVAATRRTRRAKAAATQALKAKLTPSAIAADVADAIAEVGNAIGSFASDVKQGAANRRSTYRPVIESSTGSLMMLAPDKMPATAADSPALAQPAATNSAAASQRQDSRSA